MDFHLPTDLAGLTLGLYDPNETDLIKATDDSCKKIREAISLNIWSTLKIEITKKYLPTTKPDITYKSKLYLYFTNEEKYPITIELDRCYLNGLTIDDNDRTYGNKNYYQPKFYIEKKDAKDVYSQKHSFQPAQMKEAWIPIHPKHSLKEIDDLLNSDKAGSIRFSCTIEKDSHPILINRTILF